MNIASYLLLLFQNDSSCETLHLTLIKMTENEFYENDHAGGERHFNSYE